jgi:NADPH2:quinone reductase
MRAILCTANGKPEEVLSLAEIPPPALGAGRVRIAVSAAGVNFADSLIVAGRYQDKPDLPFVPGLEVAGRVIEVGAGVATCRPGDRVMAVLDQGGFAEQAVARAEDVFALPDDLDAIEAAGFPIAYGTSHHGLAVKGALKEGETLVVLGAAGGVGLTAVEVGKAIGARVIACAGGADKVRVALARGAEFGIDYQSENLRDRVKELTGGAGADMVYDPVGGPMLEAGLRALKPGGRLMVIGFASGTVPAIPANLLLIKNLAVLGYYWGAWRRLDPASVRASMTELLGWWRAGRVRPHVSNVLPLADAARAIGLLTSRAATGKVVLALDEGMAR